MFFRKSWWPLYLVVDCLPSMERGRLENMAVPTILSSGSTLTSRDVAILVATTRRSIDEFNGEDVRVRDGRDRVWKLRVKLWSAIMDLEVSPPSPSPSSSITILPHPPFSPIAGVEEDSRHAEMAE